MKNRNLGEFANSEKNRLKVAVNASFARSYIENHRKPLLNAFPWLTLPKPYPTPRSLSWRVLDGFTAGL